MGARRIGRVLLRTLGIASTVVSTTGGPLVARGAVFPVTPLPPGSTGKPERLPGAPDSRVVLAWRGRVSARELAQLSLHGGRATARWWRGVRAHSLGWVVARDDSGMIVGFVNVAWDGGVHAFLLDTTVAPEQRRRGLATTLVQLATARARAAGCEWLHVDFEEHLTELYLGAACGFGPTHAGVIALTMQDG